MAKEKKPEDFKPADYLAWKAREITKGKGTGALKVANWVSELCGGEYKNVDAKIRTHVESDAWRAGANLGPKGSTAKKAAKKTAKKAAKKTAKKAASKKAAKRAAPAVDRKPASEAPAVPAGYDSKLAQQLSELRACDARVYDEIVHEIGEAHRKAKAAEAEAVHWQGLGALYDAKTIEKWKREAATARGERYSADDARVDGLWTSLLRHYKGENKRITEFRNQLESKA